MFSLEIEFGEHSRSRRGFLAVSVWVLDLFTTATTAENDPTIKFLVTQK